MNRVSQSLSVLGLLVVLAGCDQISSKFEIVRAGNQTYILNKNTGDAQLVDGVALVKVKSPEPAATDAASKQAKNWPPQVIPQLENLKLVVRTKYRDGRMMYSIEATPFKGRLELEYSSTDIYRHPTIYVDFYDEDGFPTGEPIELKIRGGGATRVVNAKGEPYALSWTGSQFMAVDTYRASVSLNIRWAGFGKD